MDENEVEQKETLEPEDASEVVEKKDGVRHLIFSMNDDSFAIKIAVVKEIVSDLEVYPVPFVPKYVCGFLNRQGEAYTVVDPMVILESKFQKSKKFVLLRNLGQEETDIEENFSIKITDILDFYDVSEDEIEYSECESFLWNQKKVKILDVSAIYNRLKQDFSNRYGGENDKSTYCL